MINIKRLALCFCVAGAQWEEENAVGPITVKERPL